MRRNYITLRIQGDFIDSFIYSGTLFTVTADAKVNTYSWERLVERALSKEESVESSKLRNFLLDCRSKLHLVEDLDEYHIDSAELEEARISTLPLKGWPTDINVYTNRCFIASEHGVDELAFDWKTKRLDISKKFQIWKHYAYKISANDNHRIAIAAGEKGVIAAIPRSGYIDERNDISIVLEEDSTDCEWMGNYLVSNSQGGSFLSTFQDLPKVPDGNVSSNFWKRYGEIKRRAPETERYLIGGQAPDYAWVAGEKLFSILPSGSLIAQFAERSLTVDNIEGLDDSIAEISLKENNILGRIISGRSGSFGSVVETNAALFSVTDGSVECIAQRPVGWRVFPRARSYVNHLHVVESDHLNIRAYLNDTTDGVANKFGIVVEEDDERPAP